MILTIILLVLGLVLLCFLLVLFATLKITVQGTPFLCKIQLLLCQIQFNSSLDIKIVFFRLKKQSSFEQLLEAIIQKIYAKIATKKIQNQQLQKQHTSSKKTTTKKKQKVPIDKAELLQLAKKLYCCFRIKKIELLLSWDDFPYLGILYQIKQLLPPKYQKELKISFYQPAHYYCVWHTSFGQVLYQCLFWYLKIFFKSKLIS